MKKENTASRLKYLMETRAIRQVDILTLTKPYCEKYNVKMNKSDISQYVSGKVAPNQNKLTILSMALGVNESWLAGYDVPMERQELTVESQEISSSDRRLGIRLSTYADRLLGTRLLEYFQLLTADNKQRVTDYSYKLLELQRLEDSAMPVAAHAHEDASDEDIAYDNDIMDDENF